ncbi:unnamed protein product [Cuscuta campestris]|uniref:Uncharacterized protein n=1 Tax=Cuscuta campestris TaxID=132261 RepID=A0A484N227_9ASTE|nr:unnamed protein product [Cuscuta campestris]
MDLCEATLHKHSWVQWFVGNFGCLHLLFDLFLKSDFIVWSVVNFGCIHLFELLHKLDFIMLEFTFGFETWSIFSPF